MVRVKICGITNLDDALAACDAGADALGFVFAEEAKKRGRYIDPDKAARIIEALPPFVAAVAVCVNDPPERLLEYLEIVDWVQLQGEESVADCETVARRAIKVFAAGDDFDPASMLAYPTPGYLLDACVPGQHGGQGVVCNWDAARRAVALGKPILLAGGLTPENVAEAVRQVRPYAVDVSGGVQRAPGLKDHERVRRFIEQARLPLS